MAGVSVEAVSKRYGRVTALDGVSLEVTEGSLYGLLGPSGSGKTTLLRAIAGFVFPDAGRIRIGGESVERVPVERRRIGMVFQGYALFPNMSVAENIGFGLRVAGAGAAERAERVAAALALVRLDGLGHRRPQELSGGQRQRVALARAIVTRPRVLLLDEPLSALDRALRQEMQVELRRIQRETGLTTVFVTHDQEEALTLSDRIGILRDGRLVEEGEPEAVYRAPRTRFAATFLGEANVFEGEAVPGGLRLPDGTCLATADGRPAACLAVRPEAVTLLAADGAVPEGWNAVAAVALARVFAGATETWLLGRDGAVLKAMAAGGAAPALAPGGAVRLAWPPARTIALED